MSQNYNKGERFVTFGPESGDLKHFLCRRLFVGNEGHVNYYQPSNVPQNMQSMNPRNPQQQLQQQQQPVYQGQIPVSAAHELKQLPAGMAANYTMYRPQLAQAFQNTTMMVNPMHNQQRQNYITTAGNMQVPLYFHQPAAFQQAAAYGFAPRAQAPFRATGKTS